MEDNKIIKSNALFLLNEISSPMQISKGQCNLFVIKKEGDSLGGRSFVATLKEGMCVPSASIFSYREQSYVLALVSISNMELNPTTNFDESAWEKLWVDSILDNFGKNTDTNNYVEVFIQESYDSLKNQLKLDKENSNISSHSLNAKVAEMGKLASISLKTHDEEKEEGDKLFLAIEQIAKIYKLRITRGRDVLSNENLSIEERIDNFSQLNEWRSRKIVLEKDFYKEESSPILAFKKDTLEPIIVYPNTSGAYYIDTKNKKFEFNPKVEIEGQGYLFYRLFDEEKFSIFKLLSFVFSGTKKMLINVAICSVIAALLGLITPVATAYITGDVINTANTSNLIQITTLILVLLLCQALIGAVPSMLVLLLGTQRFEAFQSALYDHILRMPVKSLKSCDAGDMTMRIMGALRAQTVIFNVLSQQFMSSIFASFSLVMMFYYAKDLAIAGCVMVLVYVCVFFTLSYLNLKPLAESTAATGRSSGMLRQFIGGLIKIRAAKAQNSVTSRFMDDFSESTKANYKVSALTGYQSVFSSIFPLIASVVFYAMAGGFMESNLSFPIFLAFMAAFQNFQGGVVGISTGIWSLLVIKPEINRLLPILNTPLEATKDKYLPENLNGDIEFSHVGFRYSEDSPMILDDVSIKAKNGEFIAIVGSSGAGKSTFVRLLLGFEECEFGEIYYSGQDLGSLNLRALRSNLGVILQNAKVMQGSILDNIITGTNYTQEDAKQALKLAAFDKEVEAMPMGIHTMVSSENISGGQQQRILIARALVGKPVAVIMDESTSALDNITQEQVKENMEKLNMTRIVIAHRLSTIINADRIYVLDKGKIVESGTHKELMALNGTFYNLAKRQQLN